MWVTITYKTFDFKQFVEVYKFETFDVEYHFNQILTMT